MRLSYSSVSTFNQCPYRWKLRYVDELKTLPNQDADNALILGSALHKGIETTVEEGVQLYLDHFYVVTDLVINWSLQLEYWIPKVKELLPPGRNEVRVSTNDYIGFVDYVSNDGTIYDYKFSNSRNWDKYLESRQLHVYKYFLEKCYPDVHIKHLKYILIPKLAIRQKKSETIVQFRQRLHAEMSKLEIEIKEIPYDESIITDYLEDCKRIENATEFPRNETRLCDWCDYKALCLEGEQIDMQLPKPERRKPGTITKRTIWLYGRPFTGKTSLADEAPMPLMLNTDGNITYVTAPFVSIKDEVTTQGRMIKRKYGWQVFEETIEELEKGDNDFKTIVVDLVEDTYEMCRVFMYHELGITHESDDSFRAWDKIRVRYLSTMRRLMNLDYENIILISHEDSSKDITKKSGENITTIKPNITDKVANKLSGMVDVVGRVVADGDKRTIQFKTDDVIFGGGRLGLGDVEIPLEWDEVVKLFDDANEKLAGGKK